MFLRFFGLCDGMGNGRAKASRELMECNRERGPPMGAVMTSGASERRHRSTRRPAFSLGIRKIPERGAVRRSAVSRDGLGILVTSSDTGSGLTNAQTFSVSSPRQLLAVLIDRHTLSPHLGYASRPTYTAYRHRRLTIYSNA